MSDGPDPYKILQVDSEAEDEVIQAAYRRLAQKYHPDVATGPGAEARMSGINAAWEILRDPARRAAYDLARRLAARTAERAGSGSTRPPASDTGSSPPGSSRWSGSGSGSGSSGGGRSTSSGPAPASPPRPPESVSGDWTSGRSSQGSGYDPSRMRAPDGLGAAGPPPGDPSGSVLNFGRFAGWSLGEIGRRDLDYIEWLDRMPIGRPYREELDAILRSTGRRKSASADAQVRRGLFRRR